MRKKVCLAITNLTDKKNSCLTLQLMRLNENKWLFAMLSKQSMASILICAVTLYDFPFFSLFLHSLIVFYF